MPAQPTFDDAYLQQLYDRAQAAAGQAMQHAGALPTPQMRTPAAYAPLVLRAAERHQVDPRLVDAVIRAESNYDPRAVSPAGAQGLMQLMPGTAADLGVRDVFDPEENIEGGVKYLAQLSKRHGGDRDLILAAYNAGPAAVQRFGGVPPYPETQSYIARVLRFVGLNVPGVTIDPRQAATGDAAQPTLALPNEAEAERQAQELEQQTRPAPEAPPPAELPALPTPLEAFQLQLASDVQATLAHPAIQRTMATPPEAPTMSLEDISMGLAVSPRPVEPGTTLPTRPGYATFGFQRETEEPGRSLRNFTASAVGGIGLLGGFLATATEETARAFNRPGALAPLAEIGRGIAQEARQMQQAVAPTMLDRTFWDKLVSTAGQTTPALVVGALSGGGTVGAGVAAFIEAGQEAESLKQQLVPLLGEGESNRRAMKSFFLNAALVGVTDRFGVFGSRANAVKYIVSTVGMNDLQEAVQYKIELSQLTVPATHPQAAALVAQGWERRGTEIVKAFKPQDLGEVLAIATVLGGVQSGIGLALTRAVEQQLPAVQQVVEQDRTEARAQIPGTLVKDADGKPLRVYHGTSAAFEQFEASREDADALYGPGFYFTESPEVAGGTGEGPGELGYALAERRLPQDLLDRIAAIDDQLDTGEALTSAEREALYVERQRLDAEGEAQRERPNVRPAYLNITRPFDIDATIPAADAEALLRAAGIAVPVSDATPIGLPTGQEVYNKLVDALGDKPAANAALQAAGYDGITHLGGAITGGEPHRVYIAFSSDQVIPAFSIDAALQAAQAPDTPPPDVPLPTWQRWAQAVLELLPEPSTAPGPTGILTGQRGAVDLFGAAVPDEGATLPPPPVQYGAYGRLPLGLRVDAPSMSIYTAPVVEDLVDRVIVTDNTGARREIPRRLLDTYTEGETVQRFAPDQHVPREAAAGSITGGEAGAIPPAPATGRQPSPEQLGLIGVPQQTTFTLSPALARATPQMGTVRLDFVSDLDKALYIIGNPQTRSANHDAYLQEVMDFLRIPERTALIAAQTRRDQIVAYGRTHGQADSTLTIPAVALSQGPQAPPGPLAQPGVMPTQQMEMPLLGAETRDMQGLPLLDADTMANLRDFLRMVDAERAQTLEIDGKPLEINYDHIATDDGVKQVLAAISEIYTDQVAKVREPRSVEQTQAEARQLNLTIEQFLTTDRENLVSRKKALVGRQMAVASARQLRVATALFKTGQLSGRDLLRVFAVHGAVQIQFARLANEAGGALQIFSAPAEGDLTSLKGFESIMEYLGSQQVHPDLLAQMIDATPTPEQLQLLVEAMPEATLKGQLLQAWYGFWLLSRPTTLLVNVLSGLGKLIETPLQRAIAARLPGARISVADATRRAALAEQQDLDPRIREREHADRAALLLRDVEKGEATAMLYSDWRSLIDAWRLAQIAFATGEPQVGIKTRTMEGLEVRQEPELSGTNLRSTGTAGQVLAAGPLGYVWDGIGAVANRVSKGMLATDEFFKFLHKRRTLHALAWRQAVQHGLVGEKTMDEIMAESEEFLAHPPPSAEMLANQEANKQTFTSDLRDAGALGRLGAGAQDMANYAPILRLFFPFIRTPVNITFDNFEKFPLTALAMKSVRADLKAGGARRDLALAKMTMGASAFGLIATFAAMGFITGSGPDDPEERNLQETTQGWQKYSLYIPAMGTYVSYQRFDPWAQYFGFVTDWVRRSGEAYSADMTQQWLEIGAAGGLSFADNIVNRNYMQGMASLVELWSKGASTSEGELTRYTKFVNKTLAGLAAPAIIAGATRAFDPRMIEVMTAWDAIKARLPFTDKTPRLDWWGDVEEVGHLWPGIDFVNPFPVKLRKHDALSRWLLDIHANVSHVSRTLLGKRTPQQGFEDEPVRHTPASWNRVKTLFAKEVTDNDGRTLRPALDAIRTAPENADAPLEAHGHLARQANRVIGRFKEAAQDRFVAENSQPGTPYYTLVSQFRLAEGGRRIRQQPGQGQEIMQNVFEQLGVR